MANYRAIANGNWSSAATWDGGGVPPNSAGHNIYANTFTVTIDTNIDVAILTNSAISATTFVGGATSASVGGTFNLNDGITVNATSINATSPATTSPTILYSGSTSATITASTAINAGTSNGNHAIRNSGTGTLTITGNCNGGGSSGQAGHAVYLSGTGTINITGNLVGGAGSGGIDTLGGTAVVNKSSGSGIINVSGNVTGSTTPSSGIANIAGGTVNVLNGNVTTTGTANGIVQSSTGVLTVNGNVTAGASAIGINNSSTGSVTIVGTLTATNGFHAVQSTNASATNRFSGSFISSPNGTQPINAPKWILNTIPTLAKTRYSLDGAGTYVDMFTADNSLGQAIPADVRLGTVYASGSLTGTLAVPPVGSVAAGVPVDATVGTATLTASDVRAAMGLASANLDTQLAAIPTASQNATQVRTELTQELTEITETHLIHGLKTGSPLNVTPTARTAGAISQTITGDGVTTTTVTR